MERLTKDDIKVEFYANDTFFEHGRKTKQLLEKKKIISPDLNKMYCVEFSNPKTFRYTKSKLRYKELLKLKQKLENNETLQPILQNKGAGKQN